MSEDLKRFLGSTVRAVEREKREIQAEKEREERQSAIQKSMRRAEYAERRQREDAERRLRDAAIEQSDRALMSFMVYRKKVFEDLSTLKGQIYDQINEKPELEQILIKGWQTQGNKVSSLPEAFKIAERNQLEILKRNIVQELRLGEVAQARFYALALGVRTERDRDYRELVWELNRPQGPPQPDYAGMILTSAVDQIQQINEVGQGQIMNLLYSPPAPHVEEQPNKVIAEILRAANIQP